MGTHLDPQLEDRILHEVKSQGVFDEFRKDSMADVDTKPAYQNLRQRVEGTVKKFLSEQHWTPDMNKNQLREKLRRHITESGFLDVGVERIVDQVVNPKIGTVFQPRIEEITYKYLGLPPPPVKHEPPPPIMHLLPPLPLGAPPPLKIETSSLLPTGLEQVSPDSDKATVKSEWREDDKSVLDMDVDVDEKLTEDEDESPPFEPLVKRLEESKPIKIEVMEKSVEEIDVELEITPPNIESVPREKLSKVESGYQQERRYAETHDTSGSANSILKNVSSSFEADVGISQDSQLSQVSSDSRISDVTANASHSFMDNSSTHNPPQTLSDQTEAVMELASANISEEAQMPKFNENSCEMAGAKSRAADLHFDIKKDEIKFEGTERKSSMMQQEGECNSRNERYSSPRQGNTTVENKYPSHQFGDLANDMNVEPINQTTGPSTPTATPNPTPHDSSFGSSLEDTSYQQYPEKLNSGVKNESAAAAEVTLSAPLHALIEMKEVSSSLNRGSSSSSRHKKHSKDKRRSHESKEKYKHRDRSKNRDRSIDKDRGNDKNRSSGKSSHRNKEESRDKDRERKEKEKCKDKNGNRSHDKHSKSKNDELDRSSSSKRSSSSTGRSRDTSSGKKEKSGASKHVNSFMSSSSSSSRSESHEARRDRRESDKKHHHSSSKNESSSKKDGSKSETAKTEVVVDDHSSEKVKVRRHKSPDSNDEDKCGGAGGHNGVSAREDGRLQSSGTRIGKQKSQHKDSKNTSPSSQSPKGKSNGGLEECGYGAKHTEDSNMINSTFETANAKEMGAQHHRNKVVILNDMLENPNINFIDLGPTMTKYSITADVAAVDITQPKMDDAPHKINITLTKRDDTTPKKYLAPTTINITSPKTEIIPPDFDNTRTVMNTVSNTSPEIEKEEQLFFFEEFNAQFSNRLRLLDHAMDRCRRVVNNLRFNCVNELCETFETLEGQRNNSETDANITTQTCATLTIDCVPAYVVGDCFRSNERNVASPAENGFDGVFELHGKRKRSNNGQLIQSKPSPTPSDASVNSKENMALDKNADVVKFVRRNASVNKLSQQRYNSEDLYKPRPVLSQRSRRRGMDAII